MVGILYCQWHTENYLRRNFYESYCIHPANDVSTNLPIICLYEALNRKNTSKKCKQWKLDSSKMLLYLLLWPCFHCTRTYKVPKGRSEWAKKIATTLRQHGQRRSTNLRSLRRLSRNETNLRMTQLSYDPLPCLKDRKGLNFLR